LRVLGQFDAAYRKFALVWAWQSLARSAPAGLSAPFMFHLLDGDGDGDYSGSIKALGDLVNGARK
jgi:hypothetical protein